MDLIIEKLLTNPEIIIWDRGQAKGVDELGEKKKEADVGFREVWL